MELREGGIDGYRFWEQRLEGRLERGQLNQTCGHVANEEKVVAFA